MFFCRRLPGGGSCRRTGGGEIGKVSGVGLRGVRCVSGSKLWCLEGAR